MKHDEGDPKPLYPKKSHPLNHDVPYPSHTPIPTPTKVTIRLQPPTQSLQTPPIIAETETATADRAPTPPLTSTPPYPATQTLLAHLFQLQNQIQAHNHRTGAQQVPYHNQYGWLIHHPISAQTKSGALLRREMAVSIILPKRGSENGSGRAGGIIRTILILSLLIRGETEIETEIEIGRGKRRLRRRLVDGRRISQLRVLEAQL